jgi:hypothetical protein
MIQSKDPRGILKLAPVKQVVLSMNSQEDVGETCGASLSSTSDTSFEEGKGAHQPTEAQTTDQSAEEEKSTSSGKKVSFSTLQIREYPICVGDNPAVTMGVPITIDWIHDSEVVCTVEEYEEVRPISRSMLELRMPNRCRVNLLRRLGFSRLEILEGTKQANITRYRRKRTCETLALSPVQEMLERAKRGTLNATFRRGAKRKERKMMNSFQPVSKDSKSFRASVSPTHLDASSLMTTRHNL